MKINISKTKIMLGGESSQDADRTVRWPCSVCGKGLGCNSLQCTECLKWLHTKCTVQKIKGSLHKVQNTFVCSRCLNPVVNRGEDSVNICCGAWG